MDQDGCLYFLSHIRVVVWHSIESVDYKRIFCRSFAQSLGCGGRRKEIILVRNGNESPVERKVCFFLSPKIACCEEIDNNLVQISKVTFVALLVFSIPSAYESN